MTLYKSIPSEIRKREKAMNLKKLGSLFSGHANVPGSVLKLMPDVSLQEIDYDYDIIDRVCGPSSWTVSIYIDKNEEYVFSETFRNEYNPKIGKDGVIDFYEMKSGKKIKRFKL